MKYIYHPEALAEYADAALYYEERTPGLAADFTIEWSLPSKRSWDPLIAGDAWRMTSADFSSVGFLTAFFTPSRRITF